MTAKRKFIGKSKVSAGIHSRHFYRANIAVTAFRMLGVGYAAIGKNRCTEDRIPAGAFVDRQADR